MQMGFPAIDRYRSSASRREEDPTPPHPPSSRIRNHPATDPRQPRPSVPSASHHPEIRGGPGPDIRHPNIMNPGNLGILLACVAVAAALLPSTAGGADITVKGSDTMVILGQKWAEVYMRKQPGAKVQVTGGGSGTGFAALQNRQTDIANASRKIRLKEVEQCVRAFGKRPKEYAVALDGLSVYVNTRNPVDTLCLEQVRDIFTGKITNWKAVGGPDAPIILYSRENSSGTYEFFKDHVLLGRDFSAKAQTLAGTAQVLQQVAADPNAIGYGGAAYGQGAKHLKIAAEKGGPAIEPTEETVVNRKYPIWRFLYVYLNPELEKGELRAYLDWIRSDEGQRVVKDVGYYPLPAEFRRR